MKIRISKQLESYLSDGQRDLLAEGAHLLTFVHAKNSHIFDDYSFLVFPFAKAYEGFLKQVFLDAGYISRKEYYSQHFRIGRVLSPNLARRLGNKSVYKKICDENGCDISELVWNTWKKGRNEVFHYFPHNIRSLSLKEAEEIVREIVLAMETIIETVKLQKVKRTLLRYDVISS